MTISRVGVIFGTESRLVQRVYIPHADDSEIGEQHVHPKETQIAVPLEVYRDGGIAAVQALIGKPTTDGRCAVVHKDTGEVIHHVVWDVTVHGDRHHDGHRIIPVG